MFIMLGMEQKNTNINSNKKINKLVSIISN